MFAVWNLSAASLARTKGFLILFTYFASASAWAQDVRKNTAACTSGSANVPLMTYDERVQYLADPDCRTNLLDSIQYVPLGQNANYYLSFDFWIRQRGEYVLPKFDGIRGLGFAAVKFAQSLSATRYNGLPFPATTGSQLEFILTCHHP